MSRALSRKVAALTLAAAAGILGATLLGASPASAHATDIVGTGVCDTKTGTWNVKLTVSNDYPLAVSLTNVVFTPALKGATLPSSIDAKTGSQNTTASSEFVVPADTKEFTVSYKATWTDKHEQTKSHTVKLHGTCVKPSTSPSPSLSAAPSSPAPSASVTPPPPGLPVTGTPTGLLLGTGAVLVVGGAGLVLALRRRRRVTFVAE